MQFSSLFTTLAVLAAATGTVMGESHTVKFNNKCGKGTPKLIQAGKTLSSGGTYKHNGAFTAAIAYLQTGPCLLNGENCMTVEMTLKDPNPGQPEKLTASSFSPSSHKFNVPIGFKYTNGCSNGATCRSASCPKTDAFHKFDDYEAQRACQAKDVGLEITFCP
ncbi:hypothetical protein PQX77_011617 [Marasmius sp. AFHP31]|nr:hypothetical protein PQX77_011617 [Marasmius sp. AFHP31]